MFLSRYLGSWPPSEKQASFVSPALLTSQDYLGASTRSSFLQDTLTQADLIYAPKAGWLTALAEINSGMKDLSLALAGTATGLLGDVRVRFPKK